MTAPLVVLLQGSVSIVGVIANLLAAPLVPGHGRRGRGGAHLRGVAGGGGLVAWVGVVPPARGIARVARRFAEVPGGTLPWPDGAAARSCSPVPPLLVLLTGRAMVTGVAAHPVLALGGSSS